MNHDTATAQRQRLRDIRVAGTSLEVALDRVVAQDQPRTVVVPGFSSSI